VAWFKPERNKKGREETQPGYSKLNEEVLMYTLPKNPNFVFPEKKLRGLRLNSKIHVSVSVLYIPTIVSPTVFSYSRIGRPILGICESLAET
jgi:hypothetical protein